MYWAIIFLGKVANSVQLTLTVTTEQIDVQLVQQGQDPSLALLRSRSARLVSYILFSNKLVILNNISIT